MGTTDTELAVSIAAEAVALGLTVTVSAAGIVTVERYFEPLDRRAYAAAEDDCLHLLARIPQTRGSTWGTTSDSVGGAIGLTNGYCRLNMSGASRRLVRALAAIDGVWTA